MWVDDLPLFGRVGFAQPNEISHGKQYFLITHRHFHIRYNKDQVITVNISTRLQPGHYMEIKKDEDLAQIHFTYSVTWSQTSIAYADRWDAQMNSNPTRYQVEAHWLWVLNSSLLVVLLTGLLAMILLRTLKNDVARYLQVDQIDAEEMREARRNGQGIYIHYTSLIILHIIISLFVYLFIMYDVSFLCMYFVYDV